MVLSINEYEESYRISLAICALDKWGWTKGISKKV